MSVQSIRSNMRRMKQRLLHENEEEHRMVASKSEMLDILKRVIRESDQL